MAELPIRYSGHALRRMFERGISQTDVAEVISTGVVVEDYPQDTPFASRLLYADVGGRPIHIVVAGDSVNGELCVVTAYEPNIGQWLPNWTVRRP